MYQASKAIDKPDPDDVIAGVTDIVRAVINPDQFSLFVLKNSTAHVRDS